MSEQAQATTSTGAAAPARPKRVRPSRAHGAARPGRQPSRANGAAKTETEAVRQAPEAQVAGEGGDRYTAGREAAAEEAQQREESVRLEAERQAALAQEAAEREAAEKEAARVRHLLADYQTLMAVASSSFSNANTAMADISATLTWEPENFGSVHLALQKVERGLADFRILLTKALSLGAEQHLRAPEADLPGCYGTALAANRELRRRIDAQISLMETDIGNVPALVAMERSVTEQAMLATLMNRGLGRLVVQEGLAR